ncbi:MAG: type I restriction-modification system specificity subunit, type I restriction enzyme M protein [Candidatus Peregrinibacteria bacterium GW2011_GWC2_39_14]|nr:MAG: Type I restriction-modification system specificity subunit [Candidatus Peregrinibacteria bacterium GW2011_GWA2_38_36]KKR06587.1 MAG: type I restriction-modification system specificity subunit, type I restriction enzyme M protein [Candidatus Peregrinibacteria bacterium GW2011_GWC2_39_14]
MATNNRTQLHERLWSAAVQLRANSGLKLNEISEPILGLIFLKFADVRFKRAQAEMEAERKNNTQGRQAPLTPDHYKSKGVLFLPEIATYSYLMSLPESENIGLAVNNAMKEIEAKNTDLAGVLPQDFTSLHKIPGENSQILITLLKNFNQIPDDIAGDAFGEIYEYFLGEFARSEGAKGGEFFTPQSIVKLLVEIIEPYHGKILDPACGSGGMFVQSANFVKAHAKTAKIMNEIAIYGQEKGSSNIRTAKMNLAIHGLSGKIAEVNSFYEDAFSSVGTFDFVLANPPFNVKGKDKNKQTVIDAAKIKGDPRYYIGLPITGQGDISNANYLWMQMFASALNPQGRAGFVMANSASDAGNAEKEIRKKMIDDGMVDVIVSVGTNMFMNATLSCTLWFFDKRKADTDRQNKVLFINAQDIFTPIDRAHSEWTDEQIQEIADIVRRYREEGGEEKYEDIKGRCKVATLEEVRANDYSLNPGRYVEIVEKEMSDVDFDVRMKELMGEFTALTAESHELEKKIADDWDKIIT